MLKVIPLAAQAGIAGFESPAAEYKQLGLDLDELLIDHPTATFIGLAKGESMTGYGIFDGDLLIVDRAAHRGSLDIVVANLNGVFVCKLFDRRAMVLLSGADEHAPKALLSYLFLLIQKLLFLLKQHTHFLGQQFYQLF